MILSQNLKSMSRGGKREGAGGKPTWRTGKTGTIRVPIAIAKKVLKFARELDETGGLEPDTQSIDLSEIPVEEVEGRKVVFVSDLIALGYEVYPLELAAIAREEMGLKGVQPKEDFRW
jgi:hypothetical protein